MRRSTLVLLTCCAALSLTAALLGAEALPAPGSNPLDFVPSPYREGALAAVILFQNIWLWIQRRKAAKKKK